MVIVIVIAIAIVIVIIVILFVITVTAINGKMEKLDVGDVMRSHLLKQLEIRQDKGKVCHWLFCSFLFAIVPILISPLIFGF